MVEISTSHWIANINVEAGGNLFRLFHRSSRIEVLRTPPSVEHLTAQPEMYGIPVLFPPNRIGGGMFNFQGRDYHLPINEKDRGNHLHGLVLGKPWHLEAVGQDFCIMDYKFIATAGFPHDFKLTMCYEFKPEGVFQRFAIRNCSPCPMPFGLGFHTAFNLPCGAFATVTASNEYWEILRPSCLPSGKLIACEQADQKFEDDRAVSLHCPIITGTIDNRSFRGMAITYPGRAIKLYYEVDECYRHWCLWNGGGKQSFFCAEPMTWMVNAPNLDLLPEVTGMQVLNPGESWKARTAFKLL
jgi:aldose 1-epimerase